MTYLVGHPEGESLRHLLSRAGAVELVDDLGEFRERLWGHYLGVGTQPYNAVLCALHFQESFDGHDMMHRVRSYVDTPLVAVANPFGIYDLSNHYGLDEEKRIAFKSLDVQWVFDTPNGHKNLERILSRKGCIPATGTSDPPATRV